MRLTCAVCSFAQDINGSIAGTVLDASGSGVPNAAISVTNTDLNAQARTAKTDHAGNYLQFRFETFNTFNHTNWASIGATLGSSTFGQVTAARDPRSAQLALKLSF